MIPRCGHSLRSNCLLGMHAVPFPSLLGELTLVCHVLVEIVPTIPERFCYLTLADGQIGERGSRHVPVGIPKQDDGWAL